MNLYGFDARFPDEASCRRYLKEKRESGVTDVCSCGETRRYWLESVGKWQCANSDCRKRTNLRAGTIMENSKLPVRTWFKAIHLITSMKKSLSAIEIKRQLEMKRYEPVWFMVQKIRMAMGKQERKYRLKGDVEMDDAFFEVVDLPKKDDLGNIIRDGNKRRGRGSQRQAKVLVMVESRENPKQKNPHKKKRIMGFVKMIVLDELTAEDIRNQVELSVEPKAKALTDGYRGYNELDLVIAKHEKMVVKPKEAGSELPWVHTMISNAKRLFLGTHHSIKKEYLQNYLDEFCYKINRRTFEEDLFDRLLFAGSQDTWY